MKTNKENTKSTMSQVCMPELGQRTLTNANTKSKISAKINCAQTFTVQFQYNNRSKLNKNYLNKFQPNTNINSKHQNSG